jgi:hypothetical protein
MTSPTHIPAFLVKQHITLMVNRYEILSPNPDGSEGPLLAFAQQKRMSFKEEVNFYSDAGKTTKLFSFKARHGLDVRAEHDVFDAEGNPIGWFKKEFASSLLRSTWQMTYDGSRPVVRSGGRSSRSCGECGTSSRFSERYGFPSYSTSTSSTSPPARW